MTIPDNIRKLVSVWRAGGLIDVTRSVARALSWRFSPSTYRTAKMRRKFQRLDEEWDRQTGMSTSGDLPVTLCGVQEGDVSPPGLVYRPIDQATFDRAMSQLGIDFAKYTFLDYGSGKGKALLLASKYPFAEIIGVEYAPLLHEVAEANLLKYRNTTQDDRLRAILCDAITFTPPMSPLACLFNNPFHESVLRRVLQSIVNSWLQNRRHVLIVYVNQRDVREKIHVLEDFSMLSPVYSDRQVAIFELANAGN